MNGHDPHSTQDDNRPGRKYMNSFAKSKERAFFGPTHKKIGSCKKKRTLREGAKVYQVSPKADIIRMAYCQIVRHRAQLGVFLRLLDIPIPGSYGPSADEPDM